MMDAATLTQVNQQLQAAGVVFEAGLTDAEIARSEADFGFRFPPDLKQWLQHELPVSEGFPNWRGGVTQALKKQVNFPCDGIYYDIEHNQFWAKAWGERPATLAEALAAAQAHLSQVPKMIPVYLHRFMSSDPHEAGNAVLSIYQTDIIYYGNDLWSYLSREFKIPNPAPTPAVPRPVRFWSDFIV